jgi:hypothetical protein
MLVDPDGRAAICEGCPDGPEFDKYRNSNEKLIYNPSDGLVYTTIDQRAVLSEVNITASNDRIGSDNGNETCNSGSEIDPAINAGLSYVGGVTEGMKQSYSYEAKNSKVKAAEKVNGQIKTANQISRSNVTHANRMAGHAKNLGRGFTLLSVGVAVYDLSNREKRTGGDYARFAGAMIITGSAAVPFIGPLVSIGLGVADSYGAFDSIYAKFD